MNPRIIFSLAIVASTVACRAHDVSRLRNAAPVEPTAVQMKTFHGTSQGEKCSLTVTWDTYGVNELLIQGSNLADFMAPQAQGQDLAFVSNTKHFSRWLQESDYGIKEQDKGFLPEYRLSHRWHLMTSGITYKFDAGWYLGQPIPGAPSNKRVLNQTLTLDGTIDPLHHEMDIESFALKQLVSASIPMPLGEKSFACKDLKAAP